MSAIRSRPSDMDPTLRLQIICDDQDDMHISIRGSAKDPLGTAVRFCTHAGGGKSLHTRRALEQLMVAMARDAEENPEA